MDKRPNRTPFEVYKNPALKRFPPFRIFPSMERVTGYRGRGLVQDSLIFRSASRFTASGSENFASFRRLPRICLLYTSDAADD